MRKLAFLAAALLLAEVAPAAAKLGVVPGALALVALGVMLAIAASGVPSALAVAGGAAGAFAGGVLASASPAAAGAALVALCYGERTSRVRGRRAVALHIGAALLGGALAGIAASSFSAAPLTVRAIAVVVAAVLLALPLLIGADDPMAHALDQAASDLEPGGAKTTSAALREGAELRRAQDDELLDRKTVKQLRRTWASLLRLAEARVRLVRVSEGPGSAAAVSGAVAKRLDERIAEHVAALSKAIAAAGAARAAEVSLDDTALRGVETAGESLEQVSRAIVDDV
jgi:MFS family permease